MQKKFNTIFTILLGTFIFMIISFYNGYPLVYSDTGTYIHSGFERSIPLDRPIFYGLFVNHISLQTSLWFVVFVQNLILSFLVFEVVKLFIESQKLNIFFLSIVTFLTLFTGIGWYTNQIMPDVFAPVLILTTFLLLFKPKINKWQYLIYSCLFIISLLVHFSHFLILIGLLAFTVLSGYILSKKLQLNKSQINYKRYITIGLLIIFTSLLIPSANYLFEKKFIVSKGSHAFLMSHLVDTGILEKYLKEKCTSDDLKDCKLCTYKDSLPREFSDFMWDAYSVDSGQSFRATADTFFVAIIV